MLPSQHKIRVLVVDDSAVARTFLIKGLSSFPNVEVVGYAINALDAKAKILRLNPDVMTLDVEMPGTNGIDFLAKLLPEHPLPVILVSSLNLRVFDALAAGAVDFVRKPDSAEGRDAFFRSLHQKIVVASCAKVVPIQRRPLLLLLARLLQLLPPPLPFWAGAPAWIWTGPSSAWEPLLAVPKPPWRF